MKINSIQIKVASLIILILTVSITSVLIFTTQNHKNELIKSTERTLSINTGILNTVIRNIMLSGEAPIATKTVQDLKTLPSLTEVSIYRIDGTTAFSDYETIDKVNNYQDTIMFSKTNRIENMMANNSNFNEVLKSRTPKQNELIETQELEYYFPILNYKECRTCHGDEEFIRGIVHFKISLKGVYKTIATSTKITTILFIAIGILITFLLYISLKKIVLKPIKTISYVVNEVGSGNLEERVILDNKDELGTLGAYINNMIVGLKERNSLLITNRVIEAKNRENKKYLDNIQEGLVLLDKEFNITGIYSLYFKKLFKIDNPEGVSIEKLIYSNNGSTEFIEFLDLIMNSLHADMDMLLEINPIDNTSVVLFDKSKIIIDAYFARVFNADDEVENIMVIFKDRTKIIQAEEELKKEKLKGLSELEIISSMLKLGNKDFESLITDLKLIIDSMETFYENNSPDNKNILLRDLHTLKGIANYLGFRQLSELLHTSETSIADNNSEFIKKTSSELKSEYELIVSIYEKFQSFIENSVDKDPLKRFFNILTTMINETSKKLEKEVNFKIESNIDEFPYLEELKGSIIHLLRNAIDHGIEDTFERIERGKSGIGTITLKLLENKNNYLIDIEDDGNGLDFNLIQKKAIEKGITKRLDLTHNELTTILFKPAFSSKENISETSGRGFGLDAVKDSVYKLKGTINIKNRNLNGTTFQIKLPKGDSL
ncbi:MAG: ATP-binding protein [Spirochaetaceae bacterium]